MARKSFRNPMDTAMDMLIGDKEEQELQNMEGLRTQGRKGHKLPRINLAFTPSNLDYVRTMAAIRGESITQYVNRLIRKDMEANGKTYEEAKALREEVYQD